MHALTVFPILVFPITGEKTAAEKLSKKKRAARGQLIFLPHNIQSGIFYGLNLAELVGEYDHAGGD